MKGPENIQSTADSILSNPYTGVQFAFDKRRRNLEKRKSRLLQYEADLKDGKKLSEQQIEARYCIGEVETQLEFLKEISRTLNSLQKEYLRSVKHRDDGMKKECAEVERKRLENFIRYQNVIDRFGKVGVKEGFLSGANDAPKITEEECKLIEDLVGAFCFNCNESESFSDCKEKSEEGSKLAHRILVGSKEKLINDFSGVQIRELLDKISNCEHVHVTAKKEHLYQADESPLESEVVEQPKKDPKVVFVHVTNGSMENYAESELNQAGDTEFGFEGAADPKVVVRDPPPPIPFPVTVVPEDPTNTISGGGNPDDIWHTETKPEASSKRRVEGVQNGFINGVEQVNSFGARGGERRQNRSKGGGAQRNDFGNGGEKGNGFGKGIESEHRMNAGRGGGGSRRQDRDGFEIPRNSRGGSRHSGRGYGGSSGRGGASNYAPRGSGYRNGNGNNYQMNGGFKGNSNGGGGGGGFNGYGFNGPPQPPRRQLGFNFASDAF